MFTNWVGCLDVRPPWRLQTMRRGLFDEAGTGWLVGWVGQFRIGFETLAQHHLRREPVQHALPAAVIGGVEAAQHEL